MYINFSDCFKPVPRDQINKLEKILTEHDIPHENYERELLGGCGICIPDQKSWQDLQIPDGEVRFSIICHGGSYGGREGLIEIWASNEEEPEGYMTADEAWKYIDKRRNVND